MFVAKKDLRSRNLTPLSLSNARPHLVMASSPFRSPVLFQCRFLSEAASLSACSCQCFDGAAQTDAFLVLGVAYVHGALGQQTNVPTPPTTATLTYDADGNTLTDGTGKVFVWDAENRLIQVTLPNSEIVRYYYDANYHRIKREHISTAQTEITTYLYDDWNVIHEKNQTIASEVTNTITKTYIWGIDLSNTLQGAGGVGGLLATNLRSSNDSVQSYSHTYDANGNTSELVNGIGEVSAHYEYDVFGKVVATTSVTGATWSIPYGFSTKPWETVSELVYYGYRYYSPKLGRWMSEDPVGTRGSLNLNSQVGNSPVNFVDVLGLWEIERNSSEALAAAKAKKGDTWQGLADEVKLNYSEIEKWLTNCDPSTPPKPGCKCKVPNTIIKYWGGEVGWFGRRWVGWDFEGLLWFGFKIVEYIHEPNWEVRSPWARGESFVFKNNGTPVANLENMVNDSSDKKELHGFFFHGHGDRLGLLSYDIDKVIFLTDNDRRKLHEHQGTMELRSAMEYANYQGYKLAVVKLRACYSNAGKPFLISEKGEFEGSEGIYYPIFPGFGGIDGGK
jgi:RHS repeat-associated protein